MNGRYLVPANASRGKLLFGLFRGVDLGIFLTGVGISFLLLMIFAGDISDVGVSITMLMPAGICTFLVLPIAYHHNVLVFLQSMYRFYTTNQRYKWKGWCISSGIEKD